MNKQEREELWLRYSSVWRNVLSHILEWPNDRIDHYIGQLRQEMETSANDPANFGFFYDLPSRYLWSSLLSGGLYEKTKGNEANPHLIYQRLVRAIAGSHLEREMEKESFNWDEARKRYQEERRKIEEWLATLD